VTVEPIDAAKMFVDRMDVDFRAALEVELAATHEEEFIPEAPEVPDMPFATTRMPDVQDFPPMVQAEIESRAGQRAPAHEERGPMGLLKKLAHGFGAREEGPEPQPARQQARPQARVEPQAPQARTHQSAPATAPQAGHGRVDDNPFAPKRTGLDRNGRITPGEKTVSEDDQLEIPAFLRRQSS
jgi:cell division protein FtsZ